MPSCGDRLRPARLGALVGLLALAAAVPVQAQPSQAASLYKEALAREATVRADADRLKPGADAAAVIERMRILVGAYHDISRLFPTSGYSDNALWQGAMLSADAFWQFGDAADRVRALDLFASLQSRFPASSLNRQVPAQVTRLESRAARALATRPPAKRAAQPAAPARRPAPVQPPTPAAAAVAPSPAAGVPRQAAGREPMSAAAARTARGTLKAVRREVLADVLRVTLELEDEVRFTEQRGDSPARLRIELLDTRAVEGLNGLSLPYRDDVVRQIRVTRPQTARTRISLDLQNAGEHSVYTLYNPYRIVIDFKRPVAAAPGRSLRAVGPAPAPPPPGAREPGASWTPAAGGASPATARLAALPSRRVLPMVAPLSMAPDLSPADAASGAVPSASSTLRASAAGLASGSAVRTGAAGAGARVAAEPPPVPPSLNGTGNFSLSRQLGLGVSRVVIDPGHGGRDPGAKAGSVTEAELTLDVALRLEVLLLKQPGVEIVLTRRTDVFVPLEERTDIANRSEADLFLSIHVNASPTGTARGIETYFLNFAPNAEAEAIAARENATSARTMRHLPDIVKAIAQNDKADESRDFASHVQSSLFSRLSRSNRVTRNLGVKQAPFMVLIGAEMPSVLAEIAFISHKQEGALLRTERYRQQVAEALAAGIASYQRSLKKTAAIAAR